VLSILAVDYPVDKVSCYVSDDGSAMLTFEALSETAEFARKWVPFCKKHNIEPRAPEFYFAQKIDYLKDKIQPSFVKERRAMKVSQEEKHALSNFCLYFTWIKWVLVFFYLFSTLYMQLSIICGVLFLVFNIIHGIEDNYVSQREYEEFKVRINALVAKAQKMPEEGWTMQDGTPWPGNNPRDHPGMIQVL
jgi:hypothetical protein